LSSDCQGIWVIGELKKEKLTSVTLELVTAGRRLANSLKHELTAVLLGYDLDHTVGTLSDYGPDRILLVSGEQMQLFFPESYAEALAAIISERKPFAILFPATYDGRDLAARLAAKLGVGLAADCTDVMVDDKGRFLQVRPAFGGNLMAVIYQPSKRPQLATIRPQIIKAVKSQERKEPIVEHVTPNLSINAYGKKILQSVREIAEESGNLDEAEVVIGIGRGLGSRDNIRNVNHLASLLHAAVGGSRGVVDAGWLPHSQQIGLTGRVISPKMYLALGISGAVQHLVGVRTAKEIVAINKDPDAPIFKVATYGIVGDLNLILPAFVKELESMVPKTQP
jgi:electron transfer flavoprotein alpha subunit